MSKTYLKIKIKSLAEEAKIIRSEELKFKKQRHDLTDLQEFFKGLEAENLYKQKYDKVNDVFWGLRNHRNGIVRDEARAALVAYGYLKGIPYRVVENPRVTRMEYGNKVYNTPVMRRVYELIYRYGPTVKYFDDIVKAVDTWMKVPITAEHQAELDKAKQEQLNKKQEAREKRKAQEAA